MSSTTRKSIEKFSTYNNDTNEYDMSAPLIAQLGKNFLEEANTYISGDELLGLACKKVSQIQNELGGRYAYLECEDKPCLIDFYTRNGFAEFARRPLEKDEDGIDGKYLLQMLRRFSRDEQIIE